MTVNPAFVLFTFWRVGGRCGAMASWQVLGIWVVRHVFFPSKVHVLGRRVLFFAVASVLKARV